VERSVRNLSCSVIWLSLEEVAILFLRFASIVMRRAPAKLRLLSLSLALLESQRMNAVLCECSFAARRDSEDLEDRICDYIVVLRSVVREIQ
jgi:hypothetical protein